MQRPHMIQLSCRLGILILALAAFHASVASANWSPFPGGVQISSQQASPDVRMAADGSGGAFVAWRTSAGGGSSVRVQHLNSSGTALWTSGGVLVHSESAAFVAFAQGPSSAGLDVCPDAAGGAFVVWTQGDETTNSQDVYAMRFNSGGVVAWGSAVAICNFSGNQMVRSIVPDGSGGAFIAWDDARNKGTVSLPNGWQLYAQHIFSSGVNTWNNNGMQISTGWAEDANEVPGNLRPVPDGIGGCYFVWSEGITAGSGTAHIQRINQFANYAFAIDGIVLATASSTDKTPGSSSALPDGSGGCIVVAETGNVTHVMLVTSSGTQPWGAGGYAVTHTDNLYSYQAVTDGQGGVIVVGENRFYSETLRAFRVTSTGTTPWGADGVVISSASNFGTLFYQAFGIAPDGLGGVLVAYGVANSSSTYQTYVQGLDNNGRRAFTGTGVLASGTLSNDPLAVYTAASPAAAANALFAWGEASSVHVQQVNLSDLDATVTPSGWPFPVVPRRTNDATPHFAPLTGFTELDPIYLNWAVTLTGPNWIPGIQIRVYLDYHNPSDYAMYDLQNISEPVSPGTFGEINDGPFTFGAGLHTLTLFADPNLGGVDSRVDQSNTANDTWSHQFTVIPHWEIAPQQKVMNWPPFKDHGALPNGIGHKFLTPSVTPGAPNAWVVSCSSKRGPTFDPNTGQLLGYGDDYGLLMFDDPVGAEPFTHQIGASQQPFNLTDFAVALAPSSPDSIWPLVVRDSVQDDHPDSSYYSLMFADGHIGPGSGAVWAGQVMAPGEVADVYLLNASVRQTLKLSLRRNGNPPADAESPLAFEVFQPIAGTVFTRGGGMGSHTMTAEIETLTFVATQTGPYPVVVFRADGSQAENALTYDFASSSTQTLDAPRVSPAELSFAGGMPNPAIGATTLAYSLPAEGEAGLEIYDVGGRRVRTLLAGRQPAGEHRVRWDARCDDGTAVRAGLYWARLTYGGRTLTRRLALMR